MWEVMLALKTSRGEWFGTIEEDQLTSLKRERRTYQQLALQIREKLDWEDLYREHPLWNPSSSVRDDDPDDDWFYHCHPFSLNRSFVHMREVKVTAIAISLV
jgi:hypothetical protein